MLKSVGEPDEHRPPLNHNNSMIDVRKKAIVAVVVISRIFLIAALTVFPNLRSTITHDSQFDKSRFNSVLAPRSHRNWFSVLCSSVPIWRRVGSGAKPRRQLSKSGSMTRFFYD
tara:strand:+ start:60 stop:401 length:342 start_codon:yes stop_codon:yes gene_type:complete